LLSNPARTFSPFIMPISLTLQFFFSFRRHLSTMMSAPLNNTPRTGAMPPSNNTFDRQESNVSASRVMSPEVTSARIAQTQRSISQTAQQLDAAKRERAKTPLQVDHVKDQEIAQLQWNLLQHQDVLRHQEEEMRRMSDMIEQQKRTISVQSETIANPRQGHPGPYETPHRSGGSQRRGTPSNYPPPPQPFYEQGTILPPTQLANFVPGYGGPPQEPFPSPFGGGPNGQFRPPPRPSTTTPQRQIRGNEYGSPEPLVQSFSQMNLNQVPTSSARQSAHGSNPRINSGPHSASRLHSRNMSTMVSGPWQAIVPYNEPEQTMAMIKATNIAKLEPIRRGFSNLLHKIEMYAYDHANVPSTHKDKQMPEHVKERLIGAASLTTAFNLMQTPYTRYMLVAKIIIQYLVHTVFRRDAFIGFDREADNMINNCLGQIYKCECRCFVFHLHSH
jgi:hypothetical protein